MISLPTGKMKKKTVWTNKEFLFFFDCSNGEKFAEKISETTGEKI